MKRTLTTLLAFILCMNITLAQETTGIDHSKALIINQLNETIKDKYVSDEPEHIERQTLLQKDELSQFFESGKLNLELVSFPKAVSLQNLNKRKLTASLSLSTAVNSAKSLPNEFRVKSDLTNVNYAYQIQHQADEIAEYIGSNNPQITNTIINELAFLNTEPSTSQKNDEEIVSNTMHTVVIENSPSSQNTVDTDPPSDDALLDLELSAFEFTKTASEPSSMGQKAEVANLDDNQKSLDFTDRLNKNKPTKLLLEEDYDSLNSMNISDPEVSNLSEGSQNTEDLLPFEKSSEKDIELKTIESIDYLYAYAYVFENVVFHVQVASLKDRKPLEQIGETMEI
ncbi:MAG: hypothetical protein NWR30_08680, partial [Salibacteraceae bacterium]|nr:hypothetical protein [Salibacteraceae bacterium]